jgi:hypothetical protein
VDSEIESLVLGLPQPFYRDDAEKLLGIKRKQSEDEQPSIPEQP